MGFFFVRNLNSFRGLKIRGPNNEPNVSDTEGVTTDQGDEDEEDEDEEEEENEGKED